MAIALNMSDKKCFVAHVRVMDMMWCDSPASGTTGITQTNANLWDLSPIALKTKPLEITKVKNMDATITTPAQESALVIVMIAEMVATSQLLVIVEVNIVIPNDGIGDKTMIFSEILGWRRKVYHPPPPPPQAKSPLVQVPAAPMVL